MILCCTGYQSQFLSLFEGSAAEMKKYKNVRLLYKHVLPPETSPALKQPPPLLAESKPKFRD